MTESLSKLNDIYFVEKNSAVVVDYRYSHTQTYVIRIYEHKKYKPSILTYTPIYWLSDIHITHTYGSKSVLTLIKINLKKHEEKHGLV